MFLHCPVMANLVTDIQTPSAMATNKYTKSSSLHPAVSRHSLAGNYSMNILYYSPFNHENTPSLKTSFRWPAIPRRRTNIRNPLATATANTVSNQWKKYPLQNRTQNLYPIAISLLLITMDVDNLHMPQLVTNHHHISIVNHPCLDQQRRCSHLQRKAWFIYHTLFTSQLHNRYQISVELILHHMNLLSFHSIQHLQHQIFTVVPICLRH